MQRATVASVFCSFSLGLAVSILLGSAPSLASPQSLTYTVTSGDTLSAIAARFHVSVAHIVRLNKLPDPDALSLGQVLRIEPISVLTSRCEHSKSVRNQRRTVAVRHVGRSHKTAAAARTPAMVAELRGLWVATHTAGAPPSLLGSFSSAERILEMEAGLTRTALRYIGVPYEWGGESFDGVDCSGFVQAVFRHNGIELPRTADAQFEVGRRVFGQDNLRPGDLVFFQTYTEGASHVGIYLGEGRFVHASASDGVRIDSLSDDYYASRYLGARREAI
jgi:murein DD-endopeptidase MepM/ murein hydrolase activator NlpD